MSKLFVFCGRSMAISHSNFPVKKTFKLLLLLVATCTFTQTYAAKDSNVVISSVKENYAFEFNKKENQVHVKQKLSTTYTCVDFRTDVAVAEFYDDKTSIDEVDIYVGGDKNKSIKPTYQYYSVDNIFFSDEHICYFSLPLEKKGSNSEVIFEKTITDPRYFTSIYFSERFNIINKTVTITVPRWMKVEFKELNFANRDIKKTVEYNSKEDADVITYTMRNLGARVSESQSPGGSYTEPHLLVLTKSADLPDNKISYFSTLDQQYAWYRSLTKDLGNNTAVIKAKAEEITAGVEGDINKIKKIFYWMHDNIRYIAFEDGLAGYKPAKADDVLRKKYGDCKGMAHLTKELLKALGYDARLCWIGTNHIAYDYSTPSLAVDNHMITALLFQGKTYYLDATENYIAFNEYAERIQGRQVLIEDGDKFIHTKVPATSFLQNLDAEKVVLTIKGVNLEGNVSREWKGEEKEHIFSQLNNIKKEKSNDAFMKFLSGSNSDYVIKDFNTSSLSDYDKPLSIKYNLQHANAVTAFGNDLYVDIDSRKDLREFTFDLKERKQDYWFRYKGNTQYEVDLTLPADYIVSAVPPNLSIKNDDYEFSASIVKMPNQLKYKRNIIIKNPKLSRAKLAQWNTDIEKLKAFYNEQIVLTKK